MAKPLNPMRLAVERGFIFLKPASFLSSLLQKAVSDPHAGFAKGTSSAHPAAQPAAQRMWNFSFTTRPSRERQRYHAETSFIGTHRRSSLR